MSTSSNAQTQLDLSDVDHRVGQLVGGGQQWSPCSATDIRRWVMALDYPNPIHWNEELALQSRFTGLIAPQSANQDNSVLVDATAEVELPL